MAQNVLLFDKREGDNGYLSNWYDSEFEFCGNKFVNTQQYLHYCRFSNFGATEYAKGILEVTDREVMVSYSLQKVEGFRKSMWDATKYEILKRGTRAKFEQNHDFLKRLIESDNMILAASSAADVSWANGVATNDPECGNVKYWRGQNLLGKILMELRREFKIRIALYGIENINYVDARNLEPNDLWNMTAGEVCCNPVFMKAVTAYTEYISDSGVKEVFMHNHSLADWERLIRLNVSKELPQAGFFEMKQDLYDMMKIG